MWINGEAIPEIIWGANTINGSAEFARSVRPVLNTIELVVGDGGGLAGFTYLIQLSMMADGPLTTVELIPDPNVTYSWEASGFGSCSASCGGGVKTQSVVCRGSNGSINYTESFCDASAKPAVSQSCNVQSCAVDCVVGEWSPFSACSATECGTYGTQTRTRDILVPASGGGLQCPNLSQSMICATQACPDQDGVKDSLDQCPNTPAGQWVDSKGCNYQKKC